MLSDRLLLFTASFTLYLRRAITHFTTVIDPLHEVDKSSYVPRASLCIFTNMVVVISQHLMDDRRRNGVDDAEPLHSYQIEVDLMTRRRRVRFVSWCNSG